MSQIVVKNLLNLLKPSLLVAFLEKEIWKDKLLSISCFFQCTYDVKVA